MQQAQRQVWVGVSDPALTAAIDAGPGNEAAAAAAVEAATQAALAAAQHERQQVQLRLASLMCSCVKAVAREQQQQQHPGSQWIAVAACYSCSHIAWACSELADLEGAVHTAQQVLQEKATAELRDKWQQVYKDRVPLPESLVTMLQHAYGSRLVTLFNPVVLKLAADYSCQLKGQKLPAQIEPQHLNSGLRTLAAMLVYSPCMQDSSSSSSCEAACSSSVQSSSGVDTASSSSSRVAAGTYQPHDSGETTSSSSSVSSADLSGAELEVQLACAAVVARAVRLYSSVLQEAFSHPCMDEDATAEARAAGAAQLLQQVAVAAKYNLLGPLPDELLQQLDSGDATPLGTVDNAAAVIGALLSDQGQLLERVGRGVKRCSGQLGRLGRSLQLPQDAVQQLQERTDELQAAFEAAKNYWHGLEHVMALQEDHEEPLGRAVHAVASSGTTAASSSQTAAAKDAEKAAIIRQRRIICNSRANWVDRRQDSYGRSLYQAMQRWADAVCAALPSRRCCSNPCCVVLREMSESNLVSGKACGGCSAADQAVRYCSKDCQVSHWQQHKALCRSRRKQQQQQGQQQHEQRE
jgi:hypothetical protein